MLSTQQQKIIEDSLWVVNTALKKQGLQCDEDLRQEAILYMCKCLDRFDPSKNIKWTTFAYKNVFLYIKRLHRLEVKKAQRYVPDEVADLKMQLENELWEQLEERTLSEDVEKLQRLMSACDDTECKILELKMKGYNGVEISKIIQCSNGKISKVMHNIKNKAREIAL